MKLIKKIWHIFVSKLKIEKSDITTKSENITI